jgi:hypothetical protein
MAKKKTSDLPAISWTKNNGDLIWKLMAEVEKPEHRLVILGKKDTSEVRELYSVVFRHSSAFLLAEFIWDV